MFCRTHGVQVEQAQASATKVEAELKDLKETLSNIEGARPFDQLTAGDIIAARPEIGKTIEEMVKKGKWSLPGYEEKFGSTYHAAVSRDVSDFFHRHWYAVSASSVVRSSYRPDDIYVAFQATYPTHP